MIEHTLFTVSEELDGQRLDKALAAAMPESGLRLRRRLCEDGRVLVQGKARKSGFKVKAGQEVEVVEGNSSWTPFELGIQTVRQDENFAAVAKPGGLHSAVIEGREDPSVEGVLDQIFPDRKPRLLNRLDNLTSGLLMVALAPQAYGLYMSLEDGGFIHKYYLARVKGRLDGMVTVKSRLDTDDRKVTRVLGQDDPDNTRWTSVSSLSHDHDGNTTLVRCLIQRGARHQIRAHLASIGHPIVGDPLYGDGQEDQPMLLHHARIEFKGFCAETPAPF